MDLVSWYGVSWWLNNYMRNILRLDGISYKDLAIWKAPHLFCISQSIIQPPSDWPDHVYCTGRWFLDESVLSTSMTAPHPDLLQFLDKTRGVGPLVYIGFGSMSIRLLVEDVMKIMKAVKNANVFAIFCTSSANWSKKLPEEVTVLSKEDQTICFIQEAQHAWLFPRV